jgi:amino acid transporter
MLLFVAFNLNQFAKRYTSAGSMYEYTVKGLGPQGRRRVRLVPALGLHVHRHRRRHRIHPLRTKLLVTQRGATGYLSHPWITLFAICMGCAWFLAYKDITCRP